MRIALIQLPIPDPNYSTIKANVPLAAGYLAAYANAHTTGRIGESMEVTICPRCITDDGGDAAIIGWLVANDFDVIGFTCYMWNIERSLRISRKLREKKIAATILVGGPEITEDCMWLSDPSVDTFVVGEGEEAFVSIIETLGIGKKPDRVIAAPPPKNLAEIPNPYIGGALSVRPGETTPFETTRGCPFGCTYCYYSKSRRTPRRFPDSAIANFFEHATSKSATDIYIMDPSFSSSTDLQKKLRTIRSANSSRIPLHVEINLEHVDSTIAELLAEAGVVSVEAGLQSVNIHALKSVKRYFNRDKFIRGAKLIGEKGITLITGIIIGLPCDTLDGFSDTCDFIVEQALSRNVEIYPLSILPGTVLRRDAHRLGMEYMNMPPYWVLESDSFRALDFIRARAIIEDKLGLALFHDVIPHFENRGDFKGYIDLRNEHALSKIIEKPECLSINCTIMADRDSIDSGRLDGIARVLMVENPSACVQLVVRSDDEIPDDALIRVSDRIFRPDHYVERIHSFDDDNQGRFGTRIFQLTKSPKLLRYLIEKCSFADPMLLLGPGLLPEVEELLIEEKPIIVVQPNIPEKEIERLRNIYSDHPDCLIRTKEKII